MEDETTNMGCLYIICAQNDRNRTQIMYHTSILGIKTWVWNPHDARIFRSMEEVQKLITDTPIHAKLRRKLAANWRIKVIQFIPSQPDHWTDIEAI